MTALEGAIVEVTGTGAWSRDELAQLDAGLRKLGVAIRFDFDDACQCGHSLARHRNEIDNCLYGACACQAFWYSGGKVVT